MRVKIKKENAMSKGVLANFRISISTIAANKSYPIPCKISLTQR